MYSLSGKYACWLLIYCLSALNPPFFVVQEPDCKLYFPYAQRQSLPIEVPRATLTGSKKQLGFFWCSVLKWLSSIQASWQGLSTESAVLAISDEGSPASLCRYDGRQHILAAIHSFLRTGGLSLHFSLKSRGSSCFQHILSHYTLEFSYSFQQQLTTFYLLNNSLHQIFLFKLRVCGFPSPDWNLTHPVCNDTHISAVLRLYHVISQQTECRSREQNLTVHCKIRSLLHHCTRY